MKVGLQKFKKLSVWQKSSEMYGLTSQIRKAAISISLNISEGSGAGSDREFRRFLGISLRSVYEVICSIEVAKRLKYCGQKHVQIILEKADELGAMLGGFMKKLRAEG